MKLTFIILLICAFFWTACGPVETTLDSTSSLENCEQALRQGWRTDSIGLHHDSILFALLPQKVGEFDFHTSRGGTHRGPRIDYAEKIVSLENKQGKFLDYILRDYGQDSAGLASLWREFKSASKGRSPHPFMKDVKSLGGCNEAFIWKQTDRRNDNTQIDAVLYGRYHITIAIDKGLPLQHIQKAWKAIPWQDWEQLGVEPRVVKFSL
ncbi:MAG: hypothetical protein AB8F95_05695 [Bacteroidia bacterium]